MTKPLDLNVDRSTKTPLAEQIRHGVAVAIESGVLEFMREGHYLRHLRRSKRAYTASREDLLAELRLHFDAVDIVPTGLAVLLRLPDGTADLTIARELLAFGMFPVPLSPWYVSVETSRSGLLLGVATSPTKVLARSCDRLADIVGRGLPPEKRSSSK